MVVLRATFQRFPVLLDGRVITGDGVHGNSQARRISQSESPTVRRWIVVRTETQSLFVLRNRSVKQNQSFGVSLARCLAAEGVAPTVEGVVVIGAEFECLPI